jgi:dephospho-CoA kinase
MRIIGITGGIGSGKSALGDYLIGKGYTVLDADLIAREVTAAGSEGLAALVGRFGGGILLPDGSLDRKGLAAEVFSDDVKRGDLNALLHGRIGARMDALLELCRAEDRHLVFLSVPLLMETGMDAAVDEVWLVEADARTRAARVKKRDGLTEAEIRGRMAAQLTDAERRGRADVILDNSGGLEELRRQADRRLNDLLNVCFNPDQEIK